jgi:hypothetical protein
MSTKHRPDHEMEVMRRGLRDLAELPPAGRKRVLAYWNDRVADLPATDGKAGPQQLDIEEPVPQMPPLPSQRDAA